MTYPWSNGAHHICLEQNPEPEPAVKTMAVEALPKILTAFTSLTGLQIPTNSIQGCENELDQSCNFYVLLMHLLQSSVHSVPIVTSDSLLQALFSHNSLKLCCHHLGSETGLPPTMAAVLKPITSKTQHQLRSTYSAYFNSQTSKDYEMFIP